MDNLSALNTASSASVSTANYNNIKAENEINEFSNSLDTAMQSKDDEELREACTDFESYFIKHMYNEMQKTVDHSNSLFQRSQATNVFTDFLVSETAENVANAGGIGLADMMFDSMKAQQEALEEPINQIDIEV